MGAGVAKALGPHRAVLLKNHGVVTVGRAIDEAVIGVIMLEDGARVQLIVEAAGDPAPEFPATDIATFKDAIGRPEQFRINFDYLVRRVKRREGK
jgi:L-fuculose-phosphate aldolase